MEQGLLRKLFTQLTVSVPEAGEALANLCENTSYNEARKTGRIGPCEVLEVAGKKRVATAPIRRALGLGDAAST